MLPPLLLLPTVFETHPGPAELRQNIIILLVYGTWRPTVRLNHCRSSALLASVTRDDVSTTSRRRGDRPRPTADLGSVIDAGHQSCIQNLVSWRHGRSFKKLQRNACMMFVCVCYSGTTRAIHTHIHVHTNTHSLKNLPGIHIRRNRGMFIFIECLQRLYGQVCVRVCV